MAESGQGGAEEIRIGSKAKENVTCAQCQAQVAGASAYAYKDAKGGSVYLCESCRSTVERALKAETEDPNMLGAVVLGLMACVVAGALWYFLSVTTGYQVGYVAIGVGFLVGWAVIIGAGRKRGPVLQFLSAGLTLATLFVSEYFMTLFYYREYLLQNQATYPDYHGEFFLISPFDTGLLMDMISPMGLVIWGVGIYFAYTLPKSRAV